METASVSVEDQAVQAELIRQINAFLSRKPVEVQKIFTLFYSMDLTISEIAALLSMKESNEKNKLYCTLRE